MADKSDILKNVNPDDILENIIKKQRKPQKYDGDYKNGYFDLNSASRLRVSLSPFAESVINYDMLSYGMESFTDAANVIFVNMWKYYAADDTESDETDGGNIETDYVFFCRTLKLWVNELLKYTNDSKFAEAYLCEKSKEMCSYINALIAERSGSGSLIYIRKELRNLIDANSKCTEAKYYGNYRLSVFLSCVLESYARKTHSQREKIMLYDKLKTVEKAIRIRQMLRITTDGKTFSVKPCKIVNDPITAYTYLACLSRPSDSKKDFEIASFRMSRAESIELRIGTGINKEEGRSIDEAIKVNGIAFLRSKAKQITIRLTKNGMKMYNNILTSRPAFSDSTEEKDGYLLTFECTEMQIKNYFFKFGKEAEIISPKELRDDFIRGYENAVKHYKSTE